MLRKLLILSLVSFILVRLSSAQETDAQKQLVQVLTQVGVIQGTIQDVQSGEPIVGATVTLKNTNLGAITDINGNFKISNVPAGEHILEVISIGYSKNLSASVSVQADEISQVNLSLKPEPIEFKEIEVRAKAFENTEGSVLKLRQKTSAITDVISSETFAKTGAGDAADAMKYVTGASVVDGKFVHIRGMGERYVIAQLNGSSLPSPDPDKKAIQMDLFPTNLLDNMTTVKSFTPDKPGDFSGGSINLKTKSFPEKFNLSFTSSTGYNSKVNYRDNFLSYPGGSRDWLGYDDGSRSVPDPLSDPNVKIPNIGESYTNQEKAYLLDFYSKSFNSIMSPSHRTVPLNQTYSFALGNQTNLFGKPLGFLGNLTYSRKFSYYDGGTTGQYHLTGNVNTVNNLAQDMLLTDAKGTDEVLWGGLLNFTYNLTPQHQFQTNYIYDRSAESMARYQSGHIPRDLAPETVYETRVLKYTQRELGSFQLSGKHTLKKSKNWELNWSSTFANSSQDEPDLRFFSNHYTVVGGDTLYSDNSNSYIVPSRYYRSLTDRSRDFNSELSFPFKNWTGLESKFKAGAYYQKVTRVFRERRYEYRQDLIDYNGDPEQFFSDSLTGIVDSSYGFYRFGNYIVDGSLARGNYNGSQKISALFGMFELPLSAKLNFIGGLRLESTEMQVQSQDTSLRLGQLSDQNLLPSLNLIYKVREDVNLRAVYGRTLARPTFRELAPYSSFDFVGDFIFTGNPELERTLIDNYDLRWEWYPRAGEILSVSGFYKNLKKPIEKVIISVNGEYQYQNVDKAQIIGAEFEIRKQLDKFFPALKNFQVGVNLTLASSKVKIAPSELAVLRSFDPKASDTRQLQGQSPYVLNLNLNYSNLKSQTVFGLYYNLFGRRLSDVSLGGTPNIYEHTRSLLDFTLSQGLWKGVNIKLAGKNMTNSTFTKAHTYKGKDYITEQHQDGRSFSVSLAYSIK